MKYTIDESTLVATSDAIRDMLGEEGLINPLDWPDAIRSISVGGTENVLPDNIISGTIEFTTASTTLEIAFEEGIVPRWVFVMVDEVADSGPAYTIVCLPWINTMVTYNYKGERSSTSAGNNLDTVVTENAVIFSGKSGNSYRFRPGFTYRWWIWI